MINVDVFQSVEPLAALALVDLVPDVQVQLVPAQNGDVGDVVKGVDRAVQVQTISVKACADAYGLLLIPGMEITTKEEVQLFSGRTAGR